MIQPDVGTGALRRTQRSRRRRDTWADLRNHWQLYLLALPAVIAVLVFNYGPLFGLSIAFLDYSPFRGLLGSEWVGLANFQEVLASPFFSTALKNSLLISSLKLAVGFPAAVILALMLNEVRSRWFKVSVQTASMLPYLLSWVVAGLIFRTLLGTDGLVNEVRSYTLGLEPLPILTDPTRFLWTIIIQDVWKGVGYGAVLYLAAMASIDTSLYEAAQVDGATRWQQTLHITLPGIANTMIVLFVISVGYLASAGFEQLVVMSNALVASTGDILETFSVRLGLSQGNYGLATVVGLFQGAISLTLLGIAQFISKRVRGQGLF